MEARDLHDVLDRLAAAGIPATLDGGWGIDALLARQTRPHQDVDLVIEQELDGGAWGRYPAGGLTGTGIIAGQWVRCITADLQLQHHLGYPPQPQDLADVRAPADRFGLEIPPGWTAGA